MTVRIPTEALRDVSLSEKDARVDIAIGLYKRGEVSLGRAAEIANVSTPEFLDALGQRRIAINLELDELDQDVESIRRAMNSG